MTHTLVYADDDFEASWLSLAATTRNVVELLRMRKSCTLVQSKEESGSADMTEPQFADPEGREDAIRIGLGDAVMVSQAELVLGEKERVENSGPDTAEDAETEKRKENRDKYVMQRLRELAAFERRAMGIK